MARETKLMSQFLWRDKHLPPNFGLKRPFYHTAVDRAQPSGSSGHVVSATGRCGAAAAASFPCWAPEQEGLQLYSGAGVPAGPPPASGPQGLRRECPRHLDASSGASRDLGPESQDTTSGGFCRRHKSLRPRFRGKWIQLQLSVAGEAKDL